VNELPHPLGPGDKLTGTWISNLLRAVRRMKPLQGPGISTRVTPDGTVLSAAPAPARAQAAAPLAPFTVRLHKTATDPDGLWEIYLPTGCCNVGGACEPINQHANETSGHEGDDGAWYALGTLGRVDALYPTHYLDHDTSKEQKKVVVKVHVKPSAKIYGFDSVSAPARRLVWAELRDAVYDAYSQTFASTSAAGIKKRDSGFPGDVMDFDVATITATRDTDYQWRLSLAQHRSVPMDATLPTGTGVSNFDLVWALDTEAPSAVDSWHPSRELVVKAVYCVRQSAAAAGITLTGAEMTDVLGALKVYARVNVTDLSDGVNTVEVLKDPDGVTTSSPYVVWLPLYDLSNNVVTADYRARSLVNLQLFHA